MSNNNKHTEGNSLELIEYVKHLKYMDGSKPQHEFTPSDILNSFLQLPQQPTVEQPCPHDSVVLVGNIVDCQKCGMKWNADTLSPIKTNMLPPVEQERDIEQEAKDFLSEIGFVWENTESAARKVAREAVKRFKKQ